MALLKGTFIQKGFIFKGKVENIGRYFHFERWLRETLKKFNVSFYDECCPTASEQAPVRYNKTTSALEYFDGSEWVAA